MMDRIRQAVFKLIGYPSDVQSLMDLLDQIDSDQVVIYPVGEFSFEMKTKNNVSKSLVFPTKAERQAFTSGFSKGVEIMGGSSKIMALSQEQADSYEEMEKLSTVRGDPKKVN